MSKRLSIILNASKLINIYNMDKKLISDITVKEAAKRGMKQIKVTPGTIITSAARDMAKSRAIEFVETKEALQKVADIAIPKVYKGIIAIGSDHGGFSMKEQLKPFIAEMGYTIKDLGTTSEEACDYPDYAFAVANLVSSGDADRGIMIDAVGVASAMVANKLAGVRAAVCQNEFSAQSSREHNDANVLTLGGRILGIELAKTIVKVWLATEFAGGRHKKRVDKISDIDLKYRKS